MRLESMEKNIAQRDEEGEQRMLRLDERMDNIEDRNNMGGGGFKSSDDLLAQSNGIFAEMTLDQLSEFAHQQRKFNDFVKKSLKNPNILSKDAVKYDGKLPENLIRDLQNIKYEIEEVNSKVSVAQNDILNISEVQKVIKMDVEGLMIERATRIKSDNFKSKILDAKDAKEMNDILVKEILALKIQQESLFEKHNVSTDKIMSLQSDLEALYKDDNNRIGGDIKNFEIRFKSRY